MVLRYQACASNASVQLRPVSSSLADYVRQLPVAGPRYCSKDLVGDLGGKLKQNLSNNNFFLPLLQTFNVLLQVEALEKLSDDHAAVKRLVRVCAMCICR
jgi:tubulin-specific chaperone D